MAGGRWRRRGRSAALALVAGALACGPSEYERLSIPDAVATGQHGRIGLTFSYVVHGYGGPMAPLLAQIRPLLAHPDPYVRMTAARYLYWVGDTSGYAALVAIVESPDPVREFGYDRERHHLTDEQLGADLRVGAATILGKYRQHDALPALRALYAQLPDSPLAGALVPFGVRVDGDRGFEPRRSRYYGIVGAREFVPQLVSTFDTTKDAEIKRQAAWSLARITGEDRWVEYLAGVARTALDPAAKGADREVLRRQILRYLGSLEHPLAHRVLEEALDSSSAEAVQWATVNLLVNQADGSEKARQVVLRQLRGEHHLLAWETLLDLAAALDDAEIAEAFATFERRDTPGMHHEWPLYNWIDEYVLVLRDPPPRVHPERLLRAAASG
jgi:HEAT repeat protein